MCLEHVVIRQKMNNALCMSCRKVNRFRYKLYARALIRSIVIRGELFLIELSTRSVRVKVPPVVYGRVRLFVGRKLLGAKGFAADPEFFFGRCYGVVFFLLTPVFR